MVRVAALGIALLPGAMALACGPASARGDGTPSDESGDSPAEDESTAPTEASTSESGSDGPEQGFAVTGILSGLQGESVSIQLGDESLVLTSDGSFAFETTLIDGSPVDVQLTSAPVGPDQSCTVSAPSSVEGADVQLLVGCITPIRHVVLLGLDGFGGNDVEEIDTPRLDALIDESAWTLSMQNGLPTSSSTNWMSMIGGATPDQHGVLHNGWQPGDSTPPPTLFCRLARRRAGST